MTSYVTQGQLQDALLTLYDHVLERINAMEASQQGQIDQLTAELGTVSTDLQTLSNDLGAAKTSIQAELDKLQAEIDAGGQVDLTALKAAADSLDPVVQSVDQAAKALGGLTPTPPVPPTP